MLIVQYWRIPSEATAALECLPRFGMGNSGIVIPFYLAICHKNAHAWNSPCLFQTILAITFVLISSTSALVTWAKLLAHADSRAMSPWLRTTPKASEGVVAMRYMPRWREKSFWMGNIILYFRRAKEIIFLRFCRIRSLGVLCKSDKTCSWMLRTSDWHFLFSKWTNGSKARAVEGKVGETTRWWFLTRGGVSKHACVFLSDHVLPPCIYPYSEKQMRPCARNCGSSRKEQTMYVVKFPLAWDLKSFWLVK